MPDEDQVEQRTQSQVCRRGLRGASGTIDDGAGRLPREGSEELIIQAEKKGWAAAAEGAKHSTRGGVQTEAQTRTDTGGQGCTEDDELRGKGRPHPATSKGWTHLPLD